MFPDKLAERFIPIFEKQICDIKVSSEIKKSLDKRLNLYPLNPHYKSIFPLRNKFIQFFKK